MKPESAIVFGGASGLGEATARKLVEAGHKVVVADLNEEKGVELVSEIGGTFAKADVTDEESVREAIAEAAGPGAGGTSDGLRICVNCAGVGAAGRIVQKGNPAPLDGYKWAININLIGTINVLSQAAAAMVGNEPDDDGQRGVCINTASIAAYDGQIGQTAYAASKGGVVGLTLPAARDLSRAAQGPGLRGPGFTATLRRLATAMATHVIYKLGPFTVPAFAGERHVRVYLPSEQPEGDPLPVLYIFDGQNIFHDDPSAAGGWYLHHAAHDLHAEGKLAPVIVGIDHGGADRIHELSPFPFEDSRGDADHLIDWLVDELVPRIHREFPVRRDVAGT